MENVKEKNSSELLSIVKLVVIFHEPELYETD